jgi:hypothetical protein
MPNKPVRTRAANSRTKPTVNCCSLEIVGEKGWLDEASQSVWRGVEDIDVLTGYLFGLLSASSCGGVLQRRLPTRPGQIELLPLNSWSSARLLDAHAWLP